MININFDDMMKNEMKKRLNEKLIEKGFDEFNRFLLILSIIFLFIDIFFKIFIIGMLEILIVIIFFYRLFSKNRYKRVKENRIFLEIFNVVKRPFVYIKKKFRKIKYSTKEKKNKNNLYKKCPKCGITLKLPLPKKIGIKHTNCPDCGTRFGFLTLKRKKMR